MNTDLMFSSKTDDWATPMSFFLQVEKEFWPFTLDPAADAVNHKAPNFFTQDQNWLSQSWYGNVWCNPPYGRGLKNWVKKCFEEIGGGGVIDLFIDTGANGYQLFSRLHI